MAAKFVVDQDCDHIYGLSAEMVLTAAPVVHNDVCMGYNLMLTKSIGTFDTIEEVNECIQKIEESDALIYQVDGYAEGI